MRLSFLVLIFLCVPAAFAQSEGPARQVLLSCAESLEPEVVGIGAIEPACPGVTQALDDLGLSEQLSETQLELLSRGGLHTLLALDDRYQHPPERASASVDSLAPVLESLRRPPTPEASKSWWERLKERLRQAFSQQDAPTDTPWLIRWLDEHRMPEIVGTILVYGLMAIVVALAVFIVINEVRAAAPGRRRKRSATAGATEAHLVLADAPEHIGSGERPSALLTRLIATLVKTGRVQGAYGLTHRELTRRARFDDSSQRESFQKVAQVAEREVFGGMAVANDELAEVLRVGHSLDAQLNGATT